MRWSFASLTAYFQASGFAFSDVSPEWQLFSDKRNPTAKGQFLSLSSFRVVFTQHTNCLFCLFFLRDANALNPFEGHLGFIWPHGLDQKRVHSLVSGQYKTCGILGSNYQGLAPGHPTSTFECCSCCTRTLWWKEETPSHNWTSQFFISKTKSKQNLHKDTSANCPTMKTTELHGASMRIRARTPFSATETFLQCRVL